MLAESVGDCLKAMILRLVAYFMVMAHEKAGNGLALADIISTDR